MGEVERRYRVHVPPGHDAANSTPVIIAFHGGGGNPESMVRLSGLSEKVDEAGFIVVYPYGSGRLAERFLTFNGGGCCGYAVERKIDDVGFTRALLDDLATMDVSANDLMWEFFQTHPRRGQAATTKAVLADPKSKSED